MNAEPPSPPHDDPPAVTLPPRSRGARSRPRRGYGRWVGLGMLVTIIGLVASTVRPGRGAFVYSKYVDEVLAQPGRYVNTELRVEGLVQSGTIENHPGSNEYRFRVERNRRSLPVHYAGIVPDTFREGIGVTVRGRLRPDGEFEAQEVVAKCPSKYEMQAAQSRGQSMPSGMLSAPAAGVRP